MIRSAKTNVSDVLGAEALVKHSDGRGRVDFELGTVEDLICRIKAGNGTSASPSKYDVVYSNAALHWVEDHPSLFADMLEHLVVSGGVLAVQVPETRFQPSHMLLRDAITAAGFSGEVGDIRLPIIPHSAQDYYTMVASRCSDVDIWSTEYMQQLPVDETYTPISSTAPDATVPRSRHPVVQYVKATGMLPILTALGGEPSERAQRYLDAYERLITEAYPIVNTPGASKPVAIFPFRRLFIIAKKL
jgi:trans-aconitate 2-methyltransferase